MSGQIELRSGHGLFGMACTRTVSSVRSSMPSVGSSQVDPYFSSGHASSGFLFGSGF